MYFINKLVRAFVMVLPVVLFLSCAERSRNIAPQPLPSPVTEPAPAEAVAVVPTVATPAPAVVQPRTRSHISPVPVSTPTPVPIPMPTITPTPIPNLSPSPAPIVPETPAPAPIEPKSTPTPTPTQTPSPVPNSSPTPLLEAKAPPPPKPAPKKIRKPRRKPLSDSYLDSLHPPEPRWKLSLTSRFTFRPSVFFASWNLTDATTGAPAILSSSLNFGLTASWEQIWSPNWKSSIFLGAQYLNFIGSSRRTISNLSQMYYSVGIGIEHSFSSRLSVGVEGAIAQAPFLNPSSFTALTITPVPIERIAASFKFKFLEIDALSLELGGKYALLFPAKTEDFTVNSGSSYRVDLTVTTGNSVKWFGGPFLERTSQNTSLFNSNYQAFGLSLGVTL